MPFISAKYDFCIKELFYNDIIRKHFISDILRIPLNHIISVRILNPYMRKKILKQKQGIVDLLMELNDNTKIHIEIQIRRRHDWPQRQVFYLAKSYTADLLSGEEYFKLKRCISISILDFNLIDNSDCHNVFLLRNAQGTIYTDILELHTLELRKNPNGDNPLNDWIRFFNAESEEELDMIKTKNPGILAAIKELKQLNITGTLREMHEARLKEIRDQKSMIAYERAEARTEGRAEGLVEGLAEGQQRINQLLQLLIRDARTDEIERMIADPQYQEQLLKEYNL